MNDLPQKKRKIQHLNVFWFSLFKEPKASCASKIVYEDSLPEENYPSAALKNTSQTRLHTIQKTKHYKSECITMYLK